MAEQQPAQPTLEPVEQPLNLIPVVLKEAALDSPTFRATAVHFGEQIDIIEKWLDNYVKSASKLAAEAASLEAIVNTFLSHATPPQQVSEAVLDHDYTVLALKRYGEGAREFWSYTLRGMKKIDGTVVEPIKTFLSSDVRSLKECRRSLDATQKNFDAVIARFAAQAKTKEPSSLREDAFQVHEARKAYMKAAMDFCVVAPQVRSNLDKMLVKLFAEQWREMKSSRDSTSSAFSKWSNDMDRVRGWSREMENGERTFKRELFMARRAIESSAENATKPSRELDDYAISTVPYLGSQATSTANLPTPAKPAPTTAEKQSWLFQRTTSGKPARTVWVRRWYFVKNGIFGWLAQGSRSGAVEESEKIGVLLCSIRPAFQEERRFCFEVKTKDTTILLQAETQTELVEWISAFDIAKKKALDDPASTDNSISRAVDAAFAISPPVAPEFAARAEGHTPQLSDDIQVFDRAATLAADGSGSVGPHASFDITRRVGEKDGESSSRDHAARLIQKLDLHRRATASPQLSGNAVPTGGIASLISASHSILPVTPATSQVPALPDSRIHVSSDMPTSTLAPSTLANPPAATNLSKTAVIVSGERGIGTGRSDAGMPSGIMANLWGSTNWGSVNRLERGDYKPRAGPPSNPSFSPKPSPRPSPLSPTLDDSALPEPTQLTLGPSSAHRKAASVGDNIGRLQTALLTTDDYPNYYPLPLKAQDAQFRILFPNVPRDERVILVFRAVWNPTEHQEFPGRVYVTPKEIYFYSNHLGLILITGVSLASIDEVTAALGRDCDFLYLHFKEPSRSDGSTRLTIKTFLEPLKLLQRRLNFLVRNANALVPASIEDVLKKLIRFEVDNSGSDGPDQDSWEDVSINTPVDGGPSNRKDTDLKSSLRIDGNLFGQSQGLGLNRSATKFKLPSQPVNHTPIGMTEKAVEKVFDISAKSLFHVLFGDKSAVSQTIYRDRSAQTVVQGPWVQSEKNPPRREFAYDVDSSPPSRGSDYQVIEVLNDHLCYVVMDKKMPWYLPFSSSFAMLSKVVITHVAKSQCKLAIFNKVEWNRQPAFGQALIERQALKDMELSALDLVDIVADQVNKLGINSRTRKAVQIFGLVGQQNVSTQVSPADIPPTLTNRKFFLKKRSLPGMVFNFARHYLIAGLLVVFNGLFTTIGIILKACTAHSLLFSLLLLSAATNIFFTQRDTFTWFQDRRASSFLSRLGVGPNTHMTRAVYIHDLVDLTNATVSFSASESESEFHIEASKCRSAFHDLLLAPSPSSTHPPSQSLSLTQTRLQRTRLRLATYRHDLLVSLRLVNRVESDVLQAEYEDFLVDESAKCERVRAMVGGLDGVKGGEKLGKEEVTRWYKEYCGSCKNEMNGLGLR